MKGRCHKSPTQAEVTPSPGSTLALGSGGEPFRVIHLEHRREPMA
ncbi:hypothetical protein [Desulfotruncus arcticus]|nr:hypothetical protein [Desulfotruncus arcticus]